MLPQVGVGLLSIPYALKQAGWVGLVLLYALGYVSCYTGAPLARGPAGALNPVIQNCVTLAGMTEYTDVA